MSLFNWWRKKYASHPKAVVVSCFFNPMHSEYRLRAFEQFYASIKHLNHEIVECVIGDAKRQLGHHANIEAIRTESLLWHKEAILNRTIAKLPKQYQYVFWIDADVLFTNLNWMTESVQAMQRRAAIVQPWEYCIHLNRDEKKPTFDVESCRALVSDPDHRHPQIWRGFAANYQTDGAIAASLNYHRHGHVGFAWGARRSILDQCPLYDKALIGGADHIIAHAAALQVPHPCIDRAFAGDIEAVNAWSHKFADACEGHLGYVPGDLYHLWHGDIDKREYLNRIIEFTKATKDITKKDANGLFVGGEDQEYIRRYFEKREVLPSKPTAHHGTARVEPTRTKVVHSHSHTTEVRHEDDGFMSSMALGYMTGLPIGRNLTGSIVGMSLHDDGHRHESHSSSPGHHAAPATIEPSVSSPEPTMTESREPPLAQDDPFS